VPSNFNGDVELPDTLRPFVKARLIGKVYWLLGGGQKVEEDKYLVDFPFDCQTVLVEATFAPGVEILIGTHLLRQHRLEINFVDQTVWLERVGRQAVPHANITLISDQNAIVVLGTEEMI